MNSSFTTELSEHGHQMAEQYRDVLHQHGVVILGSATNGLCEVLVELSPLALPDGSRLVVHPLDDGIIYYFPADVLDRMLALQDAGVPFLADSWLWVEQRRRHPPEPIYSLLAQIQIGGGWNLLCRVCAWGYEV